MLFKELREEKQMMQRQFAVEHWTREIGKRCQNNSLILQNN
jgi:hypothetical protein